MTPSTDSHLRDLERRFLQSGSPDDEAAWLTERVRVGDLTQDRLDLAAYCGHEGATRAVGVRPELSDLETWLKTLHAPHSTLVQAGIALFDTFQSSLESDRSWRDAVAAASEWLRCPCLRHRMAAWMRGRFAPPAPGDVTNGIAMAVGADNAKNAHDVLWLLANAFAERLQMTGVVPSEAQSLVLVALRSALIGLALAPPPRTRSASPRG